MDEAIQIQDGNFKADILLTYLPGHPAPKTRKLFRHLFADPWENRETISYITSWLESSINDAKKAAAIANQAYDKGHRKVNPYSRRFEDAEQRKLNRQLVDAMHRALWRLQDLEKLQSVYFEFNH